MESQNIRSARLYIAALWLGFTGLIVRGVTPMDTFSHHAGRFCFDIAGVVLIYAGLHRLFLADRTQHFVRTYALTYVFLGLCALAGVIGVARQNDWVRWSLMGMAPFVSGACMALADNPVVMRRLYKSLLVQTYIACFYALYVLTFERPNGRTEWYGGSGDGKANIAWRCMYALPFLLPVVHKLDPRHRYMLGLAYCLTILLHVIGANRGPLLSYALVLPALLIYLNYQRRKSLADVMKILRGAALTGCLALAAIGLICWASPEFTAYASSGFEETIARLTGSADDPYHPRAEFTSHMWEASYEEFAGTSSRGGELRDFLEQMEAVDYVMGRGFGGQWFSKFWGVEWNMVHIGPAHLLLVGGIPLLVVFLVLWYCALRNALGAIRQSFLAQSALCYLGVFLLTFAQHGAIADDPEVFLMWMTVGMALSCGPPRASQSDAARRAQVRRRTRERLALGIAVVPALKAGRAAGAQPLVDPS